ncbi:glutamate transport system permease protein [Sediminihabitans luteus]|uniref:Glutamate transport system permease protein n=1 Tax=Sediminihabitans luteus TaxID=1138585 RepID=A0A2M9CCF2_9CELL|nr:amino acid ABC transporter permease [Sediminihabitans luteus]PJJ69044.1 glutamate transport system permease protein [Sediminihabitans luteus]GII99430.1 ABC transporter permease [Sediminihabitans luteus]
MGDFFSQFATLFENYDVLGAFWVNIQLTFWAALLALVIGTVLALMRISPIPSLAWVGTAYVTIFRNTPLTIIMVFMTLGVWGQLKFELSQDFASNFFRLAVVALAVYHAAFVCEAIRSGVNTVPLGQAEAARAIGLSFLPAARIVILPQAFRGAVAPLGNTLIALIKNSTVAAAAGVATETSTLMKNMIEFNSSLIYAIFLTFAIGYVILVIPVGVATTALSRRLAVRR